MLSTFVSDMTPVAFEKPFLIASGKHNSYARLLTTTLMTDILTQK